ncbi:aspartyl/asparaginyl beta-hydroxylase domain-containing protein [Pseudidiomarina sediminum]|uniref:aspartyl/asparaginyl beta-hydroxylase domain-containing protein n=1 Tax=Pseudidiomarina sediminum TaxID=431675 RepID=UPI001C94A449|nr:aspartyl/asparaginyl beta-hydroxylase domain-containing protein [Pseudidiomarina sediminum]MBY6063606.1 aspartyl/asparaginyl beta-hydroxylase domain-containing protein [Pseudidiomarina sediminum]
MQKNNQEIALLEHQLKMAAEQPDLYRAIEVLEQLLAKAPQQAVYHQQLGQVLQRFCDSEAKHAQLQTLVAQYPNAFTTRLVVARFDEMKGNMQSAVHNYIRAINGAQSLGFWLNDASTAPWCRPFVQHALTVAHRERLAMGQRWQEQLKQKYGASAIQRVLKSVQMYTGETAVEHTDDRQLPKYFYVPDLPVAPQFPRESMPFLEEYEAASAGIQEELAQVLSVAQEFPRFQHEEGEDMLTEGGDWDAYFFYRHGERFEDHLTTCPYTASALERLPLCRIPKHSPEVCFSILRPGAHILPHRGVTNLRSVLHLGLSIPTGCALNLPNIMEITWQDNRAFAFDDTYLHEAWNRSDSTRIVLLADIWNPYLSDVERAALTDVMSELGDFNRAVATLSES